jgi:hypothetical protein
VPPQSSLRFLLFRGICDDTLKDIAKITMDFTKDDYSFLEPALSVSPLTVTSMVLKELLGELDTCLEPCRGRRRPAVISHVYGYSVIGFARPRKPAFARPDVPRREKQPRGHDTSDTCWHGCFCRSFDDPCETHTARPIYTRSPLGRRPAETRVIKPPS